MIKFPPLQREKTEYRLALDIGTETVKSLIFSIEDSGEGKKITILGGARRYFDELQLGGPYIFKKDAAFGGFLSAVFKETVLRTIAETYDSLRRYSQNERLLKEAKRGVAEVVLSPPADVLKARICFYSFKRSKPEKVIREKEAGEIQQQACLAIRKQLTQEFGVLLKEIRALNFKIIETKIDGYPVPRPCGYKGKTLTFKTFVTLLKEDEHERLKRLLKEDKPAAENKSGFGGPAALKITVVHLIDRLAALLKNKGISGIFLDVGGRWTQICLIQDGQISQIAEFEAGGRVVSRSISERLGLTMSEARVLKEDYSKGRLSEGVREKMREIVLIDTNNWFRELKSKLEETPLLFSDIYLFGGSSQLPEIAEILREGDWEDILFSSPKVKIIYPKDALGWWLADGHKKFADITKNINNPGDVGLILLSCYEQ